MSRWTAIVGFVLAAAAGCDGDPGRSASAEPPPALGSPAPPAEDPLARPAGFLAVLTAKQTAEVVAPYTTARATVVVVLGEAVAAGRVVARLDDRELRDDLAIARSQQRSARAQIGQAEVEAHGAAVVARREQAGEAAGISSRAEATGAAQALAKATAALGYARASAGERAARIAQLQARLHEMTLVAPIAGRVAMIYAHDGARVEVGHPVLRVISREVFVKFAIPADQVGAVKPGDPVDVRFDQRAAIAALVSHVAPEVDGVAQLVLADAELVSPPADLQPGAIGRIVPGTPRSGAGAGSTGKAR